MLFVFNQIELAGQVVASGSSQLVTWFICLCCLSPFCSFHVAIFFLLCFKQC